MGDLRIEDLLLFSAGLARVLDRKSIEDQWFSFSTVRDSYLINQSSEIITKSSEIIASELIGLEPLRTAIGVTRLGSNLEILARLPKHIPVCLFYTEIDQTSLKILTRFGLRAHRMRPESRLTEILLECRHMQQMGVFVAAQLDAYFPSKRRLPFLNYNVNFPPLLDALCLRFGLKILTLRAMAGATDTVLPFEVHDISTKSNSLFARRAFERTLTRYPAHYDWARAEFLLSDPTARVFALSFLSAASEYLDSGRKREGR